MHPELLKVLTWITTTIEHNPNLNWE